LVHIFISRLAANVPKHKKEMASELDQSDSDDDVHSDVDDSDASASVKSI